MFVPWLPILTAMTVSHPALAEGGWPDLHQPVTAAIPRPGDVAVVIGIEDYDSMLDVPGAVATAEAWQRWFQQGLGMEAPRIRLLTGAEATPDAMAAAVTEAALEVGPDEGLWFVFIGQASPSCSGDDALLFAADAGPEAAGYLKGAFTWSSLEGLLEIGAHQRAVILLDAAINERDRSLDKLGCEMLPVMPPVQLEPSDRSVLITAARPEEFARSLLGAELPAFSNLMLGALRGWADSSGDGQVTAAESVRWIGELLRATERRLPQHPQVHGAGGDLPLVAAAMPAPDLDAMLYQVALAQAQRRAATLSWSPGASEGLAAPAATEPDAEAIGTRDQLLSEMRHLSRRNAWKGVEQAFMELEQLADRGIQPGAEELSLGAQSARALGKVDAVHARLERLQIVQPDQESRQWLDELTRSYGQVSLRTRRSGASLSAVRMPLAPDQRAAIEAAAEQVATTGRFEGRLPWGVYRLGERAFVVLPGERVLEVEADRR
jgi:hypothetical protein